MALKETISLLRKLLTQMGKDLEKAERNKSAAQRVRTASITFTKLAKTYRKESLERSRSKK